MSTFTPKLNKQVKYRTQRGNTGTGKIKEIPPAGVNGQFIHVVDSTSKKLLKLRPAQLSAA